MFHLLDKSLPTKSLFAWLLNPELGVSEHLTAAAAESFLYRSMCGFKLSVCEHTSVQRGISVWENLYFWTCE